MKRKSAALILLLSMLLSFALTACKDKKGDGDDDIIYATENLDILTLSLNRLENADLNFKFNLGQESKMNVSQTADRDTSNGYYFTPNTMTTNQIDFNAFKDDQIILDRISEEARTFADFLIANVTVMNTPIYENGSYYYLSYDADSDTLYAAKYIDPEATVPEAPPIENTDPDIQFGGTLENIGGGTSTYKPPLSGNLIKIYYDENGNETVEYINFGEIEGNPFYEYVLYTKDVKYTFAHSSGSADSRGIYYNQALKVDGKWRAIKADISPSHFVLDESKPIEEYNSLFMEMFHEDDHIYKFKDYLARNEDGLYFSGGDFEMPGLWTEGITLTVNIALLDGWDEYYLNTTPNEKTQTYSEHEFGNWDPESEYPDPLDFIKFSNGMILEGGLSNTYQYLNGIGFVREHWETDVNGNPQWQLQDDESLIPRGENDLGGCIYRIMSMIDNHDISLHSQTNMSFQLMGNNEYERFKSLDILMNYYGLSFNKDRFKESFPNDLLQTIVNKNNICNSSFNALFGLDYSPENVKVAYMQIDNEFKELYQSCINTVKSYRNITPLHMGYMPKLPPELGLLNLKDNISGSIAVSNSGFDFSALNANVKKSILMASGKNYTILTYLASNENTVIVDAFEITAYSNTDMTIKGKNNISLPHIEQDGEYTLLACIARVDNGEYTRLSELVSISVNPFEEFTVTETTSFGDSYINTYSCSDGALKVNAKYNDVTAPSVSVNDIPSTDDGGLKIYNIYFTDGQSISVSDIISKISVTDAKDGKITISSLNFINTATELPISETYVFEDGKSFIFSVSDAAGNKTELHFKSHFISD